MILLQTQSGGRHLLHAVRLCESVASHAADSETVVRAAVDKRPIPLAAAGARTGRRDGKITVDSLSNYSPDGVWTKI